MKQYCSCYYWTATLDNVLFIKKSSAQPDCFQSLHNSSALFYYYYFTHFIPRFINALFTQSPAMPPPPSFFFNALEPGISSGRRAHPLIDSHHPSTVPHGKTKNSLTPSPSPLPLPFSLIHPLSSPTNSPLEHPLEGYGGLPLPSPSPPAQHDHSLSSTDQTEQVRCESERDSYFDNSGHRSAPREAAPRRSSWLFSPGGEMCVCFF